MADAPGGRPMTIFSRYMVGRFLKPFAFGLGLFALLIFLGDAFDKMNYLVKSPASLWVILKCLWLGVPYWTVRVIPMATLLATLVAVSGFVQSGEWLASQACGLETRRFWLPVLGCSLGVAALAFAAQETVMPAAWARSRRLWHEKVHPQWEWSKYQNVALDGGNGRFVQAWLFLPKDGRMERPILERLGERGVDSQLDADYAQWDTAARRWVFHRGVERVFGPDRTDETPFEERVSEFDVPPLDLVPRPLNPDELTLRELRTHARRLARLGGSPREYEVAAQAKLAYPFASVVICALGIPIALRLRRSSRVVSFCAALAISFAHLWLQEVGRAVGVGGQLPPWAAAWAANAVFALLAVELLRRWDL
ncbi:MAG: LptF/LptG family permease [Elusimicrobia bacterium]|nr:LptF/LptG family permease [Elusimicrobiota bacterium]